MAGPIVIPCPSCHTGSQKPHCQSSTCTWRACDRCELSLSITPEGYVRAISRTTAA